MGRFFKPIIISLLFSLHTAAEAQFSYTNACSIAHNNILNLNFNPASVPQEFVPWLHGYSLFVQAVANADMDKLSSDTFAPLIQQMKEYETDADYYYLCISDLYLMKSFSSVRTGAYLAAMSNYFKARQNMSKTAVWMQKRFRMLQLVLDAQLYNAAPILAEDLTVNQRIDEFCGLLADIESDTIAPQPFKTEVAILSVLLLPAIGDNGNATLRVCDNHLSRWKGSASATFAAANAFVSNGKSMDALQLLQDASNNKFLLAANRFNLLMGNLLLNLRNDSCQVFLNRYISRQNNGSDVCYAKFKLAWHFFLQGDTISAKRLCDEVKKANPVTMSDVQAQYECSLYPHWSAILIGARLLFDSGNYYGCEKLLLKNRDVLAQMSAIQVNEYAYRMGRACHKSGELHRAVEFYEIAADMQMASMLYYPSHALYYLGEIFEAEGDKERAADCFRQCQKTKSPIYMESIHRKAKMAEK